MKWGSCFEVQIVAKPSTTNDESSADAVIGRSWRRVHPGFIRVCSKLLDFQRSKRRRIKDITRKEAVI